MFEEILKEKSSWEILKSTSLPIAIYGTGNGADKVLEEFKQLGITIQGVVASDGFVRNRTFHGFTVKSISDFEKEYGDFVIALCFASPLKEVINNIKALSQKHMVIMPSVPVYGDEIFNKAFLEKHLEKIERAYTLLADQQSRLVFENIIKFQITGDLKYAFNCETDKNEAFNILKLNSKESFLDLGAYRGDTVDEFLMNVDDYEKIVAVEPDERTFKKLSLHCENFKNTTTLNNAIWSESTILTFDDNKGRGSSAQSKGKEILAITVDSIFEKYGKFTYINIDVEGAEKEMLQGAKHSLQQEKPKLCMAVYHRSQDIFSLVNEINKINPEYKFYLRHHPHISFWDTNLYCI